MNNKAKLILFGLIVAGLVFLIVFALSGDDGPQATSCDQLAQDEWLTTEERAQAQAECNETEADGSRRRYYYRPSYYGSIGGYRSDSYRGRYRNRSSWGGGFGK